jgi:hypothetical protein
LLGGHWISQQSVAAYFLLPFFHVAAISLPILICLQLSLRGINGISQQRKWGALSVGLTLSPLLIFLLEILASLLPLALLALWVSLDAERVRQLNQLAEVFRQPRSNPQTVFEHLRPYLSETTPILTLLFFAALVVPIIEEALKPLGVWFLYGRTSGALDGFISGALCGAGYALLESFLLSSSKSEWSLAVLGRSGTGAIHIFTTALLGSALTDTWQSRRYSRLLLAYLVAIFFHGTWNAFAILSALYSLADAQHGFWQAPFTQNLATVGPFIIPLLACLALVGLSAFNRRIRKAGTALDKSVSIHVSSTSRPGSSLR